MPRKIIPMPRKPRHYIAAAALLYTATVVLVLAPHWELLDLVPALLLAAIITALFSVGFAAGALLLVLARVLLPAYLGKKHP